MQTDSEFLRNFSERLDFTIHNLSLPLRSRAVMDAGQADVAAWPDWHCMTRTVAPRRRLFSSWPAEVGPFVTSLTITLTSTDCHSTRCHGCPTATYEEWRGGRERGSSILTCPKPTISPSCLKRTGFSVLKFSWKIVLGTRFSNNYSFGYKKIIQMWQTHQMIC